MYVLSTEGQFPEAEIAGTGSEELKTILINQLSALGVEAPITGFAVEACHLGWQFINAPLSTSSLKSVKK